MEFFTGKDCSTASDFQECVESKIKNGPNIPPFGIAIMVFALIIFLVTIIVLCAKFAIMAKLLSVLHNNMRKPTLREQQYGWGSSGSLFGGSSASGHVLVQPGSSNNQRAWTTASSAPTPSNLPCPPVEIPPPHNPDFVETVKVVREHSNIKVSPEPPRNEEVAK